MASGNIGLNGHTASTSKRQEEVGEGKQDSESKIQVTYQRVPFYKLFAFADSTDKLLMMMGTIGGIGNGVCMPIMTILFGDLIDSFGQNQHNDKVVDFVSK
ncbi:ABC transporter B family member 11, partial [Corchorus olitorius]